MEQNLVNYIKYCLGYVKLTRERTVAAQQKYAVNLPKEHVGLGELLNGETNDKLGELINLDTFYSYDPNEVPKTEKEQYEKEKDLANKIEGIYNKYRNDQFTKQIVFSFGYFEIELPIVSNGDTFELEDMVLASIDFVISNANTGKHIAIECDGPCHFKEEIDEAYGIHIESDEERQRVLEAAGWRFFRIKYSDWIDERFDRNTVVEAIIDLLK